MITYFSLTWQNCGLHCGEDISSTIIIVTSSKKKITYGQLDARGNVISCQDGPLQTSNGRRFFTLLEEAFNQWAGQDDFSIPVCDGSCWNIKLRFSSGKTYRIKGTVAFPPLGKQIEEELLRLSSDAGIRIYQLFGCDSYD